MLEFMEMLHDGHLLIFQWFEDFLFKPLTHLTEFGHRNICAQKKEGGLAPPSFFIRPLYLGLTATKRLLPRRFTKRTTNSSLPILEAIC